MSILILSQILFALLVVVSLFKLFKNLKSHDKDIDDLAYVLDQVLGEPLGKKLEQLKQIEVDIKNLQTIKALDPPLLPKPKGFPQWERWETKDFFDSFKTQVETSIKEYLENQNKSKPNMEYPYKPAKTKKAKGNARNRTSTK